VSLLRVVALDLFASRTDLLHHRVLRVLLDETFNRRVLVARDHDEPERVVDHALVLRRRDRQLLDTRRVTAFAVERQRRVDPMLLRPLVDPLVHAAEDLLVAGGSLGELHPRDRMSAGNAAPGPAAGG
jgi:hypothetical protein